MLERKDGWAKIAIVLDSGAGESVAPRGVPGAGKMRTSATSAGITYQPAGGKAIKNEGEFDVLGSTKEGDSVKWTFQVADIVRPLGAMSDVEKMGNRIELDGKGKRYIVNKKTGQKTQIKVRNGVYEVELWVRDQDGKAVLGVEDEDSEEEEEGFMRQVDEML